MDLRKSVLKKQQNVLCDSLNCSTLSAYESALEDGDSTLYFSLNETTNSMDDSRNENAPNISICSEADKENTVIMREQPRQTDDFQMKRELNLKLSSEANVKLSINEVFTRSEEMEPDRNVSVAAELQKDDPIEENVIEEISTLQGQNAEGILIASSSEISGKLSINEVLTCSEEIDQGSKVSLAVFVHPKELQSDQPIKGNIIAEIATLQGQRAEVALMPEIMITDADDFPNVTIGNIVQDPNENPVNPFTAPVGEVPDSIFELPKPSGAIKKTTLVLGEKKTRRSTAVVSKLPSLRVYSPVIRKSLDRKSKTVSRLATIYRSIQKVEKPRLSRSKSPNKPKTAVKVHKCSAAGCSSEFRTIRAYQEHQQTHKAACSSSASLMCQYCDKKFQVQAG